MRFIIILIIFTGVFMLDMRQYYPSEGEQLLNSLLAKSAKNIAQKYNIIPCGSGASMPGGPIRKVTLCFDTKSIYTKDQLRKLLVVSAQKLVKQFRENSDIEVILRKSRSL